MKHVVPIRETPDSKIHFLPYEGANTVLCGQGNMFRTVRGGIQIPNMVVIDEPVDCGNCRKSLEVLIRGQLDKLTATGMEKVLEMIGEMRNGQLRS